MAYLLTHLFHSFTFVLQVHGRMWRLRCSLFVVSMVKLYSGVSDLIKPNGNTFDVYFLRKDTLRNMVLRKINITNTYFQNSERCALLRNNNSLLGFSHASCYRLPVSIQFYFWNILEGLDLCPNSPQLYVIEVNCGRGQGGLNRTRHGIPSRRFRCLSRKHTLFHDTFARALPLLIFM